MKHLPTIMLILSAPTGILGHAAGAWLVASLSVPADINGILILFVPLFLAGLCMLPFLIPFFDHKAKATSRNTLGSGNRSRRKAATNPAPPRAS